MQKIVFLTGTRADFGKLKSLISISQESKLYEVHIFVTGMHMNSVYGSTIDEVRKHGFKNIYPFINHDSIENMDRTLAKTIDGFSHFISEIKPDLVIVHGDRVEAMAGAIVGSLNNILVAHIEGGEVSGTIDGLVRHAVSKMSHIHLVSNNEAKSRLIQLGEISSSIFILGSPDLDLMNPETLPELINVKKYYNIGFEDFALAILHPVTTEHENTRQNAGQFVDALLGSNENYIVIFPNNDLGSSEILNEYKRLANNDKIKIFPSLRFEYFLTLLKTANYIVGNSSAGIREAPFYNTITIDVGSRQSNRGKGSSIFHANDDYDSIMQTISIAKNYNSDVLEQKSNFGKGDSDKIFLDLLNADQIWSIDCQKQFQDIEYKKD
jgi:UDP-N-acetylglucosamine 2-epimerase (hydrolysing)